MKLNKKVLFVSFAIVASVVVGGSLFIYNYINNTGFKIDKTVYIYIDESKDYEKLLSDLDTVAHIESTSNFDKLASFKEYKKSMKTGRYAITPNMNAKILVSNLLRGIQSPVRVIFNNLRTKDNLTERLAEELMFSKSDLDSILADTLLLAKYGFNEQTIPAMFIPNTYEFYWDVSVNNFVDRMNKEYKRFWSEKRLNQASELGLNPIEVSILASIVEEECTFRDEYPIVAGLYLNRLKKGQKLQADPTVKFAIGDFGLRRILIKHLEIDSPYNTYQNVGLPPGPIRVPSIQGIDAVLNYAEHNYYYMCAKEDFSGRHNFAKTHTEHQRNANKYRAALNQRRIYQ